MIITNRVIDPGEGWGVWVTQNEPFAVSVYVGGCQHGHGSIVISRPGMAWRGMTHRCYIEHWYAFTDTFGSKYNQIPMCIKAEACMEWWGNLSQMSPESRIATGCWIGESNRRRSEHRLDCTELYMIAKEARATMNGVGIVDWLGEHLSHCPLAMLQDANLTIDQVPELWRAGL